MGNKFLKNVIPNDRSSGGGGAVSPWSGVIRPTTLLILALAKAATPAGTILCASAAKPWKALMHVHEHDTTRPALSTDTLKKDFLVLSLLRILPSS